MDLGLHDKHAIVTGGSRGIGKAIARELAREGVDVAIVARNKADLEASARELAAETNRRIIPLAADVTSKEQVERMVADAAAQLGGVHILVNSGSAPGGSATATGPIETVVDEDLIEDFNVKYVGALRCARAVIPFMKEAGWGRIINISGGNARNAGNLSGGARNAGLVHMTKTLAVQLGRHGITVNCIHPGTTRTERTPSLLATRAKQLGMSAEEAERQDFAPDSPRGNAICRMVDASEVAFVAASWPQKRRGRSPASWLWQAAAPGGRYITEQTNRLKVGSALGRSGMDKERSGETMKLGAFFHPTGNHVAAWLHPDAQIDAGTNFRHYAEITQTAERGKFDLMFVADAVATRDGKLEALSRWPQYMAYFDPLTLLPALAAVTTHIGLCATATTSYNEPYHIARKFASLDHISGGRAGWNVVTSSNVSEAFNFGRERHYEHDARYDRA